jgi:hypothetical protein
MLLVQRTLLGQQGAVMLVYYLYAKFILKLKQHSIGLLQQVDSIFLVN